jgi:5-methylcytosine-specific restriction endonuclease McrA
MRNALGWLWIILQENMRLLRAASRVSASYWQRIHSASWITLKNAIIQEQGGHCYRCGVIEVLELHHLHYRNLWHEEFERDVVALCKKCHLVADNERKIKYA